MGKDHEFRIHTVAVLMDFFIYHHARNQDVINHLRLWCCKPSIQERTGIRPRKHPSLKVNVKAPPPPPLHTFSFLAT